MILLTIFFREALRALLRNRLRSSLATLGITIGIAAVVLVIAVGQAGAARVQAELQKLGDDLVWLEAGSRNVAGVRTGTRGVTTLTLEDAEAIRREIHLITRVSPQIDGTVMAISSTKNWTTRFRGGSPDYVVIRRWALALGHNFTDEDVEQTAAKVVLGQTVREQLFGALDPVGQQIRVQGQPFEVIGVLAPKGQSPEGRDQDDWILLPYTSAQRRFKGRSVTWLDDIFCSAVSASAVPKASEQLVALMRQRHGIGPGQEDDFNLRRADEVLRAQENSADTLAALLIAVASVSLIVGGIGIMNVMLASVAQRTREIGLRAAVGATEWAVRIQFLGEASALGLVGGVLGVVVSVVAIVVLRDTLDWTIAVPPSAVAVALSSSIAVGLFFGFFPAWSASKLDPIEALRHE